MTKKTIEEYLQEIQNHPALTVKDKKTLSTNFLGKAPTKKSRNIAFTIMLTVSAGMLWFYTVLETEITTNPEALGITTLLPFWQYLIIISVITLTALFKLNNIFGNKAVEKEYQDELFKVLIKKDKNVLKNILSETEDETYRTHLEYIIDYDDEDDEY
jgi:hypothetical protein